MSQPNTSSQLLIALCAPFFIALISAEFALSKKRGIVELVDLLLNVPVLWAVHQIHHQSEEFNFSVGLRQAWFHKLVSFPIYISFALLGYGPELYVHRVHHGANQECVNRNFGGLLSVWDHLFGTYREVEGEPICGVTRGPGTFDPWGANVAPLAALAAEARKARGVRAKLRALLVPGPLTTREFELAPGLGVAPRFFGALVFLLAFSTFGRSLDSSDAEALSGQESLA